MNLYRERRRPTRGRILEVALLTVTILSLVAFSASAKFQQVQLLRIINVGAGASATILGATTGQRLSGNGTAGNYDVNLGNLRARAIATGDVNGDGISDIVAGAPEATFTVTPPGGPDQVRTGAGVAYVVLGVSGLSGQIETGAGEASLSILGAASGDKLGFAVAVGDVNGDGIDDIAIGAPGADFPGVATPPPPPRADTGAVFVIFGAADLGSPSTLDLATANAADVVLFGVNSDDQFGAAVAVGNVGGLAAQTPVQQAVKDIVVGAPGNDGPGGTRLGAGAAYAQFGGEILNPVAGATKVFDLAATAANVVVLGKTGDALGASVATGDVNGAGVGDLLLGAPLSERSAIMGVPAASDTGAVFGVFGGTNLIPDVGTSKSFDIDSGQQNLSIYGAGGSDHLGVSVAAGDVTGDGIPDVLAGAPDADGPSGDRASAGEAYVVRGGAELNPDVGSEKRLDLFGDGASATLFGGSSGDRLGSTVIAGNYNTAENFDSVPDLIAGAPGGNGGVGLVSIVLGGPNLLLFPNRDVLLGQDDLRVVGQSVGDELGWAIATGDINNNQGGELIVGAPFADAVSGMATATDAGVVYILPSTSVINQSPTVTVTAPNSGETLQVAQVFDITWTASDPNGDETIQKFEIRLSTDGGTNFNFTVAPNVAGTARKFTWTVPAGFNTSQGRIRVIVTDNQNATAQDDSDENFTITDVGVTASLTTPDGGETLRFGQQFTIEWTVPDEAAPLIKGFDLSLSTDGGATFPIQIAPKVGDPAEPALGPMARSFVWTVPSICTSTARVALVTTSLSNLRTSDASAANFAIAEPGPTIDPNGMAIVDNFRLKLLTAAPPGGVEVVFSVGTLVQISSDAAGTTFFSFSKANGKIKKQGQKYLSKGLINGQELGAFFPNGATRFIRITKPVCGITLLRVTRNGDILMLATAAQAEPVLQQRVWQ